MLGGSADLATVLTMEYRAKGKRRGGSNSGSLKVAESSLASSLAFYEGQEPPEF